VCSKVLLRMDRLPVLNGVPCLKASDRSALFVVGGPLPLRATKVFTDDHQAVATDEHQSSRPEAWSTSGHREGVRLPDQRRRASLFVGRPTSGRRTRPEGGRPPSGGSARRRETRGAGPSRAGPAGRVRGPGAGRDRPALPRPWQTRASRSGPRPPPDRLRAGLRRTRDGAGHGRAPGRARVGRLRPDRRVRDRPLAAHAALLGAPGVGHGAP
jgi:hypothetical protein